MIRIFLINWGICRNPSESSKIPRVVIFMQYYAQVLCVTVDSTKALFSSSGSVWRSQWQSCLERHKRPMGWRIWSLSQNPGARLGVLGGDAYRRCFAHLVFLVLEIPAFFYCAFWENLLKLFVDPNFFPLCSCRAWSLWTIVAGEPRRRSFFFEKFRLNFNSQARGALLVPEVKDFLGEAKQHKNH